jgi:hypothetical protein
MEYTQHYAHLLTFPFRGEGAFGKFAIACLVVALGYIVPVLPWIVFMGYVATIMLEVTRSEPARMREWTDWGMLFKKGANLFGVALVYSLPANLLYFGGFFVYFVSMFIFILAAENNPNAAAPLMLVFMPFFLFLVMSAAMLLSLVSALVLPLAAANSTARERFSAGFDFRTMWGVFRANPGGFLIVILLGAGMLALMLIVFQIIYMTMILCALLPFLLIIFSAYWVIVLGALMADAYSVGARAAAPSTAVASASLPV